MNKFLLVLAVLLLSACTSVPLSTMWKLRSSSPLETPAQDLSVAIRSPKLIDLRSAKTALDFGYQWSGSASDKVVENFDLVLSPSNLLPESVGRDLESNEQVHILRLAKSDHTRFSQAQHKIKQLKKTHPDGKGWFSVGLSAFCLKSRTEPEELLVNIYLQTEKLGEYLHLIRNLNVSKELEWNQATCKEPSVSI